MVTCSRCREQGHKSNQCKKIEAPGTSIHEGMYRAVGFNFTGYLWGRECHTIESAEMGRKDTAKYAPETWIEQYENGQWKRVT